MAQPRVYVVSGGMGASGEQLARTSMAQFNASDVEIVVLPGVHTGADLRAAIEEAASSPGLVIHTLVDPDLRTLLVSTARDHGLVELDVIGPVLDGMAELLGADPAGTPGLYRRLREDYFRRVDAIEFAVRHDDGRRCSELDDADIVLTGVSRTGKTPLSMYLAMRGYRTANIPLVQGISPPDQLFEVNRRKVVGLSLATERLVAHRRRRQRELGAGTSRSYSDPGETFLDQEHALQIFRKGRFAVIDVTDKPIEESASEVVELVPRRRQLPMTKTE